MKDIEARLQQVEDRLAIEQLFGDYLSVMDAGDYAAYAQLYTEDGELMFQSFHLKGRKAIRESMERGARGAKSPGMGLRHLMSNLVVRVDGDRASANARWIVMSAGPDGRPVIGGTGLYQDTLKKEGDDWKFQRRVITNDIPFIEVAALKS